ncbi:arginine biosynthesis bifunctional protein ArgJ [Striga asiatica]|uniref:Arginine biosynthesis bifunctional protein ArgJ n=1 Tax=Striga asiatica TaxID=4170 RepID=A0A5A7QRY8_STRAF|nr:arginine biosynthesis bifunctional protein ArgJ [Striga asiatica]
MSKTAEREAVLAEADAKVGSEVGQDKAKAGAQENEEKGKARDRRIEATATAAEVERGSAVFGIGIEIGWRSRARVGLAAAEELKVVVFGRDPPWTEAEASCSRGDVDIPCLRISCGFRGFCLLVDTSMFNCAYVYARRNFQWQNEGDF